MYFSSLNHHLHAHSNPPTPGLCEPYTGFVLMPLKFPLFSICLCQKSQAILANMIRSKLKFNWAVQKPINLQVLGRDKALTWIKTNFSSHISIANSLRQKQIIHNYLTIPSSEINQGPRSSKWRLSSPLWRSP